jgi:hypothetical protein
MGLNGDSMPAAIPKVGAQAIGEGQSKRLYRSKAANA